MIRHIVELQGKFSQIEKVMEFLKGTNPFSGEEQIFCFNKIIPFPKNFSFPSDYEKKRWAISARDTSNEPENITLNIPLHKKSCKYEFYTNQKPIFILLQKLSEIFWYHYAFSIEISYKCYCNDGHLYKKRFLNGKTVAESTCLIPNPLIWDGE